MLLAAVGLLAAAGQACGNPLESLDRLSDRWGLFQGVQISGHNTLTLQEHGIEGAAAVFESQRWDTGTLQRQTSLRVEGPIWKELGFQSDLSFSGYGASYSRWLVGYVGHDTALYFGDLNISMRNNEFASFAKSLKGWQLDQKLPGDGLLRAFTSETKGYTRNETLSGNDTPGPYFLSYTPIIDGSEAVKVDEQVQERGVDYSLNYQTGELWFVPVEGPGKVIPSTSTISVSYQSSGYFGNAGILTGARVQMPLKAGKLVVGVTWLEQDRPEAGQGDTVAYQEDVYYGSGSTGPFDTNFRPIIADGAEVIYQGQAQTITEALEVFVDNVQMLEGVDYDAYRQIGRVIFRLAVPPTSLVHIQYYYELGETALSGDAQVSGLDLSYEASKNLWLRTAFAQSDSQGNSGRALQTIVSYQQPTYDLLATYRDVAPQFTYIDSTGFRRNDKGLKLNLGWRPGRYVSIRSHLEDMDSTQGYSFGYSGYSGGTGFNTGYYPLQAEGVRPLQTTPVRDVGTKRTDVAVELRFPSWPTATLSRETMSNAGGTQSNSNYVRTSLDLSHGFGSKLRADLSLSDTEQRNQGTAETDAVLGSATREQRLVLRYDPSSSLNLHAQVGSNRSAAVGGEDNRSESDYVRLRGSWSPSQKLSFTVDRSASKSHGRVTSGFYGDFPGSGYGGGGGFPGPIAGAVDGELGPTAGRMWPAQDDEDDEVPHYEDTTTNLSATYQPTRRLSLMLSIGQRNYLSGGGSGYLADSDQKYQNMAMTWRATDEIRLTTNFSDDVLRFFEEGRGAVTSQSVIFGVDYQPKDRPWGLDLSVNRMSGNSPSYVLIGGHERYYQTATDLTDLSGQLHYRLGDKATLTGRAGFSDFDSGYAAFRKQTADLGVTYDMGQSDLTFSYRFIGHRAGEPSSPFIGYTGVVAQSQDYNAHTFMLGLESSFASGMGRAGFRGPSATMDTGQRRGTFGGYQAGFGQDWSSYGGSERGRQGSSHQDYSSGFPQW